MEIQEVTLGDVLFAVAGSGRLAACRKRNADVQKAWAKQKIMLTLCRYPWLCKATHAKDEFLEKDQAAVVSG